MDIIGIWRLLIWFILMTLFKRFLKDMRQPPQMTKTEFLFLCSVNLITVAAAAEATQSPPPARTKASCTTPGRPSGTAITTTISGPGPPVTARAASATSRTPTWPRAAGGRPTTTTSKTKSMLCTTLLLLTAHVGLVRVATWPENAKPEAVILWHYLSFLLPSTSKLVNNPRRRIFLGLVTIASTVKQFNQVLKIGIQRKF